MFEHGLTFKNIVACMYLVMYKDLIPIKMTPANRKTFFEQFEL